MDEASSESREESRPSPGDQRSRLPLPILIGVAIGIGLSFWIARQYFGDSAPQMNAEALAAAQQRWREAAVSDYNVEVEVEVGSRPKETYAVEIRDGQPGRAWRNGAPLKQVRVFDTWSVPGMFATIARDVEGTDAGKLTLRGEFDEQTGAPLSYRRIEWGSDHEVSWEITKFDVESPAQER